MTSSPGFYTLHLNLYDVINDVTDWLQQTWDIIFLKTTVFKVIKILDHKRHSPINSTK